VLCELKNNFDCILATRFSESINEQKINLMAKETIVKDNPVVDALRKLKEEESELVAKLKPVQEAIAALEKIVDKSVKKTKPSSSAKDNAGEGQNAEEALELADAN
jgi:hypothetical protein